jgi:hypothetical protein
MTTRPRKNDIFVGSLHGPRPLAEKPAGWHPAWPIALAVPAFTVTRSGGDCPAARRDLAASRVRRCGTRTPVSGPAGDQRLASHRPWPARIGGAAGPPCLSPGRPAGSRDGWPLCRRTSPAAIRRMPGKAGPPAARRPGWGTARLLRFRSSRWPAIARSPQPGVSPGCEVRLTGSARARVTAGRVPRVYLPLTSHGPGRETAGQRRI